MRNSFLGKIFMLLISLIFVGVSCFIVPSQLKDLKEFKNDCIKVECVVVDYRTNYNREDRTYTYSPVYLYSDKEGNEHELTSNVYTSRKPVNGTKKEVYVNPENPSSYYNGVFDILLPLILFPGISTLALVFSIIMLTKRY